MRENEEILAHLLDQPTHHEPIENTVRMVCNDHHWASLRDIGQSRGVKSRQELQFPDGSLPKALARNGRTLVIEIQLMKSGLARCLLDQLDRFALQKRLGVIRIGEVWLGHLNFVIPPQ